MNTIMQKVSASMLFAVAGTFLTVGCECNRETQSSSSSSGYYSSDSDSAVASNRNNNSSDTNLRSNTPANSNITDTVDQPTTYTAASSPDVDRNTRTDNTNARREVDNSGQNYQNDRYARGYGNEYVHTPQEGTRLETDPALRSDNRSSYDRDDMASRNRREGSDYSNSRNSTGYSSTGSTESTGALVAPPVDPNETREARDARLAREEQNRSEIQQASEARDTRDARETRDARLARDAQDHSETQQSREARETREARDRQIGSNDRNRDANSNNSDYTRDSRRDNRRADGTYYTGNSNDRYNSDQVEYKTDIYGRKFVDHPDNFEYIHDEQLGVYLIANTPSEYNGHTDNRRTSRDRDRNWNNDQYRDSDREMARSERDMNREVNRDTSRDATRDMNRDLANDTNRNNDLNRDRRAGNNIDSAPVFTPVTRSDTTDRTTTAATTPRTDSLRNDSKETVQTLTSNWSGEQREAITALVAKYGQPDELTTSAVIWKDKGGFLCTKVLKDSIDHKFPVAHKDFLEQSISYKVPVEMADELLAFDGSLIIDRTRGTLAARSDKEEHNLLAFNLANDIVNGTKSVEQARIALSQMTSAATNGQRNPYLEKLQFESQLSTASDR